MVALGLSASAQSTAVRAFDLGSGAALLAPRAGGGHLMLSRDANAFLPVLVRLDAAGQTVGSQQLDLNTGVGFSDAATLADGRQVLVGYGDNGGQSHGFTLLVDTTGLPGPARFCGYSNASELIGVTPTDDGGFLAMGNGFNPAGNYVGLLLKFDAQMDTVWTRLLQPGPNERLSLKYATELPSGDILAAGERATGNFSTYHLCLYRFTAGGDLLWANEYPLAGPLSQPIRAMHYDGQAGIFIASLATDPANFASRIAISAFDTTGNFLWADSIGGLREPEVRGIAQGPGGEVVLIGDGSDPNFQLVGFSTAVGASGGLWANTFSINGAGTLLDILPRPGGGYRIVAGDFAQAFLLDTDAQGKVGDSCGIAALAMTFGPLSTSTVPFQPVVGSGIHLTPIAASATPFGITNQVQCLATGLPPSHAGAQGSVVAPQPMRTSARIRLAATALADDMQLHFTDLHGRALTPPLTRLPDGFEVQRGDLPAGIYAYQVLQGGQRIASGKLWVAD
jgi:hypothetical protein